MTTDKMKAALAEAQGIAQTLAIDGCATRIRLLEMEQEQAQAKGDTATVGQLGKMIKQLRDLQDELNEAGI